MGSYHRQDMDKVSSMSCNNSFIDRASLFGQDGWVLAATFFHVFMKLDAVTFNKPLSSHLVSHLVNNAYEMF